MNLDRGINSIRDILRSEGITGFDSIHHCISFIVCVFYRRFM